MLGDVHIHARVFLFFYLHTTIKTFIWPEMVPDVNAERRPLEPRNEACAVSQAPNLTS